MAQAVDTSTCHLGIRLIVRPQPDVLEHSGAGGGA
jgi:hypothetical protein